MKHLSLLLIPIFIGLTILDSAAAEHFGIPVYPAAKTDALTASLCKEATEKLMTTWGDDFGKRHATVTFCYRTGDAVEKVAEFYQGRTEVEAMGPVTTTGPTKHALFCLPGFQCASMGPGTEVAIISPWADSSKKVQNDTLLIFRQTSRK